MQHYMFVLNIFVFLLKVYHTVSKIVKIIYNLFCIDMLGSFVWVCVFCWFRWFQTVSLIDNIKCNMSGTVCKY